MDNPRGHVNSTGKDGDGDLVLNIESRVSLDLHTVQEYVYRQYLEGNDVCTNIGFHFAEINSYGHQERAGAERETRMEKEEKNSSRVSVTIRGRSEQKKRTRRFTREGENGKKNVHKIENFNFFV